MKHLVRVVALVGIIIAVGIPAAAQPQVSGGVRVGVNVANLSADPAPPFDLETLTGLVVGGFVTVPVTDVLSFQPEALYSRQGTKFSDSGLTAKAKLDYFQIPLLAHVRTGAHSPLAILFGPSLGFRTGATLTGPGLTSADTAGFEDQFKGFDFGLTAGAAVEAGHVVLDGRYTWGLTNILKENVGGEINTDKAKNNVFSLSAGIRF